MIRLPYFVLFAALTVCGTAFGQTTSVLPPTAPSLAPPPPIALTPTCNSGHAGTLSVPGRGLAQATADVAEISLNIAILNETAQGAQETAAGYASNVINAVRQVNGVSPDNVTTTSVSVYPRTNYNSTAGTSTVIGYVYTNSLSIRLDNLTGQLLSTVLDTAVRSGGNNLTITSTRFSLSPALSYNRTVDARQQAASDARATARQYARALGTSLGPVLTVSDLSISSTPIQPTAASGASSGVVSNIAATSASSASTPVNIGMQQVTAAISVTYTICGAAT